MNEISRPCKLCGHRGPHRTLTVREMMFGTKDEYEYFLCVSCSSLQVVTVPDADELKRHYAGDYYSFASPERSKVRRWLSTKRDRYELGTGGHLVGRLTAILRPDLVVQVLGKLALSPDARILDVGCGAGHLLDRMARAGFTNLSGADPFITADSRTPAGVPIYKKYLNDIRGPFDLIIFSHSLEHTPDPAAMLRAAREKLDVGGMCLVRVPTTSSEAWQLYQEDWVQIDAPRHLVIPSREGLAMVAAAVGMRVDKTIDDSSDFQFWGSEQYRQGVALADPRAQTLFRRSQFADWKKRAAVLNQQGIGDQASFVLSAV